MEKELAGMREKVVENLGELALLAEKTIKIKGCHVYFAADRLKAQDVLAGILEGQKQVTRSYSKTLKEIEFDEFMSAKKTRVDMTCLTEIIMERTGSAGPGYPSVPAAHAGREKIKKAMREYLGTSDIFDFQELKRLAHQKIKERIIASEFGITGANSLSAENGALVLAEDEGNARAVSNLPYNHVAVVGIEKIARSTEEAMTTVQAAALYGTERKIPAYISLISGPSRTGDIEFRIVRGMHGPREVHVILLDNGRLALVKQGYGALLKCVDCGSCTNFCRKIALENKWEGVSLTLTMKGISLALIQGRVKRPQAQSVPISGGFSCPVNIKVKEFKRALSEIEKE